MKEYKEYKIDLAMYNGKVREALSAAVQYHAFELGYKWSFGKEVLYKKSPYLFLDEYGYITYLDYEDMRFFERHGGAEISAADFLALNTEEPELKPFDRVLVRDFDNEEWRIDIFEERCIDKPYQYQCLKSQWHQCIPYEGNECFLGTDELF